MPGGAAPEFSHKKHSPLKLACTYCHQTVGKAVRAGFPSAATCKTCHTTMEDATIPARRVYKLADFVTFSHAPHVNAKVECARCHGAVSEQDVVRRVVDHSMKACMDCHKQTNATLTCNACHELGQ